jgi:hypothetical protein
VTRERAAAIRSPLLAVFAYNPPRLFLTPSERELLSEALSGVTDETLSARLGIPLTAVKARWARIQHRAAEALPALFADVPMPSHGGRGVRTRHLILDYVRKNPSELTPYAAPRGRARQHRVT